MSLIQSGHRRHSGHQSLLSSFTNTFTNSGTDNSNSNQRSVSETRKSNHQTSPTTALSRLGGVVVKRNSHSKGSQDEEREEREREREDKEDKKKKEEEKKKKVETLKKELKKEEKRAREVAKEILRSVHQDMSKNILNNQRKGLRVSMSTSEVRTTTLPGKVANGTASVTGTGTGTGTRTSTGSGSSQSALVLGGINGMNGSMTSSLIHLTSPLLNVPLDLADGI